MQKDIRLGAASDFQVNRKFWPTQGPKKITISVPPQNGEEVSNWHVASPVANNFFNYTV